MTLLETLYKHLRYNDLTANAEHFSKHYLNKSRSWYAVQTHEGRDFSASAAFNCLTSINEKLKEDTIGKKQKILLEKLGTKLIEYLKFKLQK